ncbi:hypothetical protein E3E12_06785 [Formicincola oecophyllae]|uniref:RNA-binding S4 domain-containing protein n=1 Tax=Formicincola oecophyllae TaxID=2558361 RepID=A0A4Y6UAH4_9PROT|nr:S4 domain-containing protein [Formicincola oecophyllae]QDH14463.1 hypothetical protein E3E12_06785 [Formicincola oecophyllae]
MNKPTSQQEGPDEAQLDQLPDQLPEQRLDVWFYNARLAKTRALTAKLAGSGKVRLNGRRLTKAHAKVRPGDVLTFPAPGNSREAKVLVWRVRACVERRGPAKLAQRLYAALPPNPS